MQTQAITKSKLLVSPDLESLLPNESDSATIQLAFSAIRGDTLLGAVQGEHATAYALYKEFIISVLQKHIALNADSGKHSVTDMVEEIFRRAAAILSTSSHTQ